jgi:hypothetical protein
VAGVKPDHPLSRIICHPVSLSTSPSVPFGCGFQSQVGGSAADAGLPTEAGTKIGPPSGLRLTACLVPPE